MTTRWSLAGAALFCVACSSNPASQTPDAAPEFSIHDTKTGAAAKVTREDIDRMKFTRIEDYITARVPGVQVSRRGGQVLLQVRGPNTIHGNNEPLIILDGVALAQGTGGFSLANLSPRDVEQIEVLKDAGSTAIYGSRGANGVVVIRTRRSQ